MYHYIACNTEQSNHHFYKMDLVNEVTSMGHQENDSVKVYRIQDIKDAINTSVLMEANEKESYLQMLSSDRKEFDADTKFSKICEDLGSVDVK